MWTIIIPCEEKTDLSFHCLQAELTPHNETVSSVWKRSFLNLQLFTFYVHNESSDYFLFFASFSSYFWFCSTCPVWFSQHYRLSEELMGESKYRTWIHHDRPIWWSCCCVSAGCAVILPVIVHWCYVMLYFSLFHCPVKTKKVKAALNWNETFLLCTATKTHNSLRDRSIIISSSKVFVHI